MAPRHETTVHHVGRVVHNWPLPTAGSKCLVSQDQPLTESSAQEETQKLQDPSERQSKEAGICAESHTSTSIVFLSPFSLCTNWQTTEAVKTWQRFWLVF